jgi:deoxycytidylate deaminase
MGNYSIVKKALTPSHGVNSDRELWNGSCYSAHAETDAIRKLMHTNIGSRGGKGKKVYAINLIVIRVDSKGKLNNSKPCAKCIKHLTRLKQYNVRKIYYSDANGNIIKSSLTELANDEDKHVSRRFRVKKYYK